MAVKPNAKSLVIKEQIVEDSASGLKFKFEVSPATDAPYRVIIYGDALPFGNREILFDRDGREAGAGTYTGSPCAPSWLREV